MNLGHGKADDPDEVKRILSEYLPRRLFSTSRGGNSQSDDGQDHSQISSKPWMWCSPINAAA